MTVSKTFKSTALPAGGYLYQNLVGLEILLDWLDEPTRFSWVELECEQTDIAPKALDDIIAEYSDGRRLYRQVKCANDSRDPRSALSWAWLLEKSGNRRSLIRKLFDASIQIPADAQAEIALVTNRRPDREFAETLATLFVDWSRVPLPVKVLVHKELGPESDVIPFLSRLEFHHSKSDFALFEELLRNRFVSRHGDDLAWGHFKWEALEWLVLRGAPGERNRISLEEVRRIAAATRPRPLREDFELPAGYSVPNESFHRDFLEKVTSSKGGGFVLQGSPGLGKSTYLSYLCSELTQRVIPWVRHHYFLPVDRSNPRRFFMDDVADTLIHHIEAEYPQYRPDAQPKAEYLREWVESCASGSFKEGKPFVVVIDGLDHLWREMEHDVGPLEALLSKLIPLPPNMVLLLGTQPLSDEAMPATLRRSRSSFSWLPMSGMSTLAIAHWVSKQIEEQRFSLPGPQADRQEYVGELADALFRISSGHPLHVIYSLEMLLNSGQPVTSYWIEGLPSCPDGNIRSYYDELWARLNYVAQDVLHLISAFEFLWSRDALLAVLGDTSETASALSSVRHLTHATLLGLKPFHSSLAAHVREYSEHNPRVGRLLPKVIDWLKDRAPDYLRWGWLWLTQARGGNPQPLVDGPSWDWVLESLTRGYPPSQMIRITEESERLVFREENYARAVELRWLKTRLLNGPDFQIDDFSRLEALTFESSDLNPRVEETLQDLQGAGTKTLSVLGEYLVRQGRQRDAERCLEEVKNRFNRKVGLHLRSEDEAELYSLMSLLGATGKYDPAQLMHWINRGKLQREKDFLTLLLAISRQTDIARMLALTNQPKTKKMQRALEVEAIRLACRLSVDISGWPEFQRFTFHPLSACWALIHRSKDLGLPEHETPEELLAESYLSSQAENILEDWLHWHFFWCVAKSFVDAVPVLPSIELPKVPWITSAIPVLQEAARFAGQRLRRGDAVGFSYVWRFLNRLVKGKGHEDHSAEFCLRRAVVHISTDLGLLNSSRYGSIPVSSADIRIATDSCYFYIGHLRARCLKRGERLMTTEEAAAHVSGELDSLAKSVTPFNERLELYCDLAEFASIHGLRELVERAVKRAAQCLVGYGWRKDYSIFLILEAITACAKRKLSDCESWVRRIGPAVEQITEYTDGDEVGQAREDFAAVLLEVNPTLYLAYYESLIRRAEWALAEDVLDTYLKKATTSKPLQALIATLFEGSLLSSLIARVGSPEEITARLQLTNLGQDQPHLPERYSSPEQTTEFGFDVAVYPPAKFDEFLELLEKENRVSYDSKVVNRWFEYWVAGQPADVLTLMEQVFAKDDVTRTFRDIPDRLFEAAMRLQGKEKAYRWLVLGHIHNHGWSSEYTRGTEYRRRFELVAEHYPDKWRNFIKETSEPSRTRRRWDDTLIIGNSRLVEFLLLVGQSGSAAAVTEALVSCFERELIEQPLPYPDWLE